MKRILLNYWYAVMMFLLLAFTIGYFEYADYIDARSIKLAMNGHQYNSGHNILASSAVLAGSGGSGGEATIIIVNYKNK
jgi:hypothetical protein